MKSQDRTADASSHVSGAGALELVVILADGLRVVHLPTAGTLTLGRSAEADVTLDDSSASRLHARLYLGLHVEIEDLRSANGTFLRGLRLGPNARVRLDVGEAFRIGRTQLMLRMVSRPMPEASGLAKATSDDMEPVLESPAIRALFALATQVAKGGISVLLLGETGVGKDVTARLVHRTSPRASGPFVAINCAAISESLWESELFGHERGAYTGATSAKAGLLESADGGTVFLDEVGEIPIHVQAKLLRVLEDHTVQRVGAKVGRRIDVRYVAATNRDLEQDIERGRFRKDLFFRLSAATLHLPPLRERPEDLPILVARFVRLACASLAKAPVGLSPSTMHALLSYPFPGNVRELRNLLERAVLVCGEGPILPEHLALRSAATARAAPPARAQPDLPPQPAPESSPRRAGVDLRQAVQEAEREQIVAALAASAGNQTRAAELLGISRRALVAKLSGYNLPRPRKRGE